MGYLFTVDQSSSFFEALRVATIEFLEECDLPISEGSKHYSRWEHGRPLGVTSHYTAGVTWKGSVRWLNDGGNNNQVSCQMLILDRMLPGYLNIISKYPELDGLEAVTLLLSDGIVPCWHAGWVNKINFGIEKRNAGIVKGVSGDWRWWANNWKAKFPHRTLGKSPILIDGVWWEPYTYSQIHDEILVCQHLHALYQKHGGLDQRWFLPHSATTGTKSDTGRAYPIHDVRNAVFAQMPIEGIPWLQAFAADPLGYARDIESGDDELFLLELEERQTDRMLGELDWDAAVSCPSADLQELVDNGNWREELDSVRRGLSRLGYVTGWQGNELDEDTALAVYQFQRSVDLTPDKVPGSVTQRALHRRLSGLRLL